MGEAGSVGPNQGQAKEREEIAARPETAVRSPPPLQRPTASGGPGEGVISESRLQAAMNIMSPAKPSLLSRDSDPGFEGVRRGWDDWEPLRHSPSAERGENRMMHRLLSSSTYSDLGEAKKLMQRERQRRGPK